MALRKERKVPYLVYDVEASLVIPASPFPTREAAEQFIERTVSSRNLPGVETAERFEVVEVRSYAS